jgi:hypothetical protein
MSHVISFTRPTGETGTYTRIFELFFLWSFLFPLLSCSLYIIISLDSRTSQQVVVYSARLHIPPVEILSIQRLILLKAG